MRVPAWCEQVLHKIAVRGGVFDTAFSMELPPGPVPDRVTFEADHERASSARSTASVKEDTTATLNVRVRSEIERRSATMPD